ncbi:MAG: hypothetical protein HDKAJFGB_02807 [Anaerolineae bacterium]|nr:hypothetical protein [Anaerolineae bacterium]
MPESMDENANLAHQSEFPRIFLVFFFRVDSLKFAQIRVSDPVAEMLRNRITIFTSGSSSCAALVQPARVIFFDYFNSKRVAARHLDRVVTARRAPLRVII